MKTWNVRVRQWDRYIDRIIKLDPETEGGRWVERWYNRHASRYNRRKVTRRRTR